MQLDQLRPFDVMESRIEKYRRNGSGR